MSAAETAEARAAALHAVAAEIDALASRTARTARQVETHGADSIQVTALRRAADRLAETADALRRDGLLGHDQQRLI